MTPEQKLWPDDYIGQILNMDCLEAMRGMPDGCVDLVITDPPYGLNTKMSSGGTWAINPIYDDVPDWDIKVSQKYIKELFRVSKSQIIWGGHLYKLPISRCWLAWIKNESMPTMGDFELAWTSFDKVSKCFKERRNPDGKRIHPTQKPVSLMAWCIKNYSNENDLIFDPFAGSGTTCVAAQALGRQFIGIDISAKYCEIARERLKQQILI